ncbi:TonB-dependent receptor plug domain-containing protein [Lacinutrix neustonica]|uniref:TonB-dependent receptor plug domain-containing protein n=1 Tax=Lacinutrix neustonica TaxID=2980107 RepID=UPI0036F422FC
MVLRGYASLTGDNAALIVIDGIPSAQTSINDLNANDIESINILKGASSVTLYGSKGANGALIITTKRGKDNGKINFSFDSAVTFEDVKFFPNYKHNTEVGLQILLTMIQLKTKVGGQDMMVQSVE